jgi:hypothetical protein
MADAEEHPERAAGAEKRSRPTRRRAPRGAAARRETASPESESVPDKERLERLRSVLERRARFG